MKGFKGIVHVPSSTFCSCSRSLPLSLFVLCLADSGNTINFEASFSSSCCLAAALPYPNTPDCFHILLFFVKKKKIRFYVTFLFDGKYFFLFIGKKRRNIIIFSFFFFSFKGKKTLKKKVYDDLCYSCDRSGVDLTNSQTRPRRTLPYTQPQPNRFTYLASGYLERSVG